MPLLGPADQDRLRAEFSLMTRRVHLLFFTQALGCETCLLTRQILDEFPPLSERVVIDEVNFVLDPERARQYGIDRVPAIAVLYEDEAATLPPPDTAARVQRDSRIRFLGMPAGYEFVSLVQAILLAGGRDSELSAASRERLALVDKPVVMQVFTTPT
jgi:alkyl hydroperoxide reductase subunit AhpF